MEFDNIGSHWSYVLWKQKDFLPFTCDACLKVFCKEHRSYRSHECDKPDNYDSVQIIICPIWTARIKIIGSQDVDKIFEEHEKTEWNPLNVTKVKKDKWLKWKTVTLLCFIQV